VDSITSLISQSVCEYQTDVGLADYALFVGKQAAGIIEAKKGTPAYKITTVKEQTKVMLLPISN